LQIEEKCLGASENKKLPNKISDGRMNLPLHKMTEEELADVIFYISDTTRTLQCFISDVFCEAAETFYEVSMPLELDKYDYFLRNLLLSSFDLSIHLNQKES